MTELTELREQINKLGTEMSGMMAKAREEKRELTADENTKFDALDADREKLKANEKRLLKAAELDTSDERRSDPNPIEMTRRQPAPADQITAADRDLALRAWLLYGADEAELTEGHYAAAKRCQIDIRRKQFTFRLAPVALRSSVQQHEPTFDDRERWVKDCQEVEKRAAMGVGSGSIGGYSVPDAPMRAIEIAMLAYGGMRRTSTVWRTDTGADLPVPTNNDTSNKGRLLAENTQVTETDLTLGQVVFQSYKFSSDVVLVSVEFLQDTSLDASGFIGTALGTRIARSQNDYFTTGTGISQPNGIVTAATSSTVTASGQTTCTYDNLVDLIHSVDPAYRENGRFMLHDSALKMIKKIKVLQYSGDTVGAPLWTPGLIASQPDLILGYEYSINQSLATVATGTKSVLFGDLSKYVIRDVRDITLIRLDERYADYHQVGFLAFARADGDLLDAGTHPVKYMTQA